ncbi:class B sortase [Oscillospiraceae bacterium LTW-04]|nr:class B sortase [Oscillospiraceae bacterium MB24-C1]
MAKNRMAKKSPMSSIVIVALALLIFIVAVSIGVSLLKKSDVTEKPSSSTSESISEPSSSSDVSESEPESSSSSESEPASSSEASSSSPASSSNVATSSSKASSSTAAVSNTLPATFDPTIMGASGKANIPSYKQINADVKAWLKIPGTNINYPVLQSASGYNPHYYLDKNIYRQTSRDGVIYAGSTCKFGTGSAGLSKNTVLFGHNWTNYSAAPRIGNASDVMFGQLAAYHYLNFAKAYPYLWFSTESQEMTWVIFAAFYTDVSFNYIEPNPTDAGFSAIISGAKARSRHNFNIEVSTSDKILTMSTCTRAYGSSDKQRFVVMARLLRSGETLKEVGVTTNPNPVLPNL